MLAVLYCFVYSTKLILTNLGCVSQTRLRGHSQTQGTKVVEPQLELGQSYFQNATFSHKQGCHSASTRCLFLSSKFSLSPIFGVLIYYPSNYLLYFSRNFEFWPIRFLLSIIGFAWDLAQGFFF